MTNSMLADQPGAVSVDAKLASLLEEAAQKLQRGESVDLASLALDHPSHADALRELLPTIAAMVGMTRKSSDVSAGLSGMLGKYQLMAKLGEGGMGAVYMALHTELQKIVALKVLRSSRMNDSGAVARFRREMKAAGRFEHPNIVRASDAGEEQGTHFLVMEYVDGCDLSRLVRRLGPLPISDGAEIIRQTAQGLEFAHRNGMVHRDVKPSNIMLNRQGQVKILDMGLALLNDEHFAEHADLTGTGQMIGTIDYMAPEQGSDSHAVDSRVDVYSLGATLYQLLSGNAPFVGVEFGTLMKKMQALASLPATPLDRLRTDVPKELAAIVARMLAKNPSDRFGTAAEVAAAVEPFAAGSNVAALVRSAPTAPVQRSTDSSAISTSNQLRTDATESTIDTDPRVPKPLNLPQAAPPARRWRWPAVATAVLGPLVVAGVVLLVRDESGKEKVRVALDKGDKVEVVQEMDAGKTVGTVPGKNVKGKNATVADDGIQFGANSPDLLVGRTYTFNARGFGNERGVVSLVIGNTTLSCPIRFWSSFNVTFEVPNEGLVSPGTGAELRITRPDGTDVVSRVVRLVNRPPVLTHVAASIIGSGKESRAGVPLPSGPTFDSKRPELAVPVTAGPVDKLNITRMFYCREDTVSTGPRSARPRTVDLWVPVPDGTLAQVVAERTDAGVQYVTPSRDLPDGVYCLHTGQFSSDAGVVAPQFCAPFIVRGYGQPETGEVSVTPEGKGVKLSIKIRNKGGGVFDDGFIVVTLQKGSSENSEFKGRNHLKLAPIPAHGEVERTYVWDMSDAEPGTYHFYGHVNYNYLWDANELCEVLSDRFDWQGRKSDEKQTANSEPKANSKRRNAAKAVSNSDFAVYLGCGFVGSPGALHQVSLAGETTGTILLSDPPDGLAIRDGSLVVAYATPTVGGGQMLVVGPDGQLDRLPLKKKFPAPIAMALDHNTKDLLIADNEEHKVYRVSQPNNEVKLLFAAPLDADHDHFPSMSVAGTADGHFLFSASDPKGVYRLSANDDKLPDRLLEDDAGLAAQPGTNRWVAMAGDKLRVFDGAKEQPAIPCPPSSKFWHYKVLAFAPDGRLFVVLETGVGLEVQSLGLDDRKFRRQFVWKGQQIRSLAVGPVMAWKDGSKASNTDAPEIVDPEFGEPSL